MCIVIDVNAFASVFEKSASDHADFAPVLRWIQSGCGKLIYGGTTYFKELKYSRKYVGFIVELHRAGKAIDIHSSIVDREEKRLRKLVKDADFDDPHIVAIVIASMCRLVCTKDKRSHQHLLNKRLYPSRVRVPKIYSGSQNATLLVPKNVAEICKDTSSAARLRRRLTSSISV